MVFSEDGADRVSFQRKGSDGTSQPIRHPVSTAQPVASKIAFALIFTEVNAKRDSQTLCMSTSNDQKLN